MSNGKSANCFIALVDGAIILWDVQKQAQYELDDQHLQRIIEIWRGATLSTTEVDETIARSGILDSGAVYDHWRWDVLSRFFHLGTRATLPPGASLPTVDDYDGYLAYCASILNEMPTMTVRRTGHTIALPPINDTMLPEASLWKTLHARKTCRDFNAESVSLSELATTLHWTFGAIHGSQQQDLLDHGLVSAGYRRSTPSAGSLQATEAYVAALRVDGLPPDIYHYRSETHELTVLGVEIDGPTLGGLLGAQMFSQDLAFGIFFTSRFEKLWWKYPRSRAYRVALLDVGALLQTFLLSATALGLKTWPTGHFYDDEINALLGIDGVSETTLFFAGAGHGSGSPFSRTARQAIENEKIARGLSTPTESGETR